MNVIIGQYDPDSRDLARKSAKAVALIVALAIALDAHAPGILRKALESSRIPVADSRQSNTNPVSGLSGISGYQVREAGSSSPNELASTRGTATPTAPAIVIAQPSETAAQGRATGASEPAASPHTQYPKTAQGSAAGLYPPVIVAPNQAPASVQTGQVAQSSTAGAAPGQQDRPVSASSREIRQSEHAAIGSGQYSRQYQPPQGANNQAITQPGFVAQSPSGTPSVASGAGRSAPASAMPGSMNNPDNGLVAATTGRNPGGMQNPSTVSNPKVGGGPNTGLTPRISAEPKSRTGPSISLRNEPPVQ